MKATCVVVADPIRATIYAVPRGMARLRRLDDLRHSPMCAKRDAGNSPVREVETSEQVLAATKTRTGGFAGQLALYLEDAHRNRQFAGLSSMVSSATVARLPRSSFAPGCVAPSTGPLPAVARNSGFQAPEIVHLRWFHATRPGLDRHLVMRRAVSGRYVASGSRLEPGAWYAQLDADGWRPKARLIASDGPQRVRLDPVESQGQQ